MKTAMTELIDEMYRTYTLPHMTGTGFMEHIMKYAKDLLEKEKEQIMNAYEDGYEACDMDEAMEVNKKLTSGKFYYNMNYNQNK